MILVRNLVIVIENNLKTIEDALTEAIEDMKSKKRVSEQSEKKN